MFTTQTITRASTDQKWGISLATCMRIWRAGCIIQSGKSLLRNCRFMIKVGS